MLCQRLQEAKSINKSLSSLGLVMKALTEPGFVVPPTLLVRLVHVVTLHEGQSCMLPRLQAPRVTLRVVCCMLHGACAS